MKKLLFTFSILAAVLTSCDCKHGYGPNDCRETWASNYTGTWTASVNCAGQTTGGNSTITEESPTSIRIDGDIYARLDEWNRFTIPEQQFGANMISGSGRMIETTQNTGGGALVGVSRSIEFSFDVYSNGNYEGSCSTTLTQ